MVPQWINGSLETLELNLPEEQRVPDGQAVANEERRLAMGGPVEVETWGVENELREDDDTKREVEVLSEEMRGRKLLGCLLSHLNKINKPSMRHMICNLL